MGLSIVKEITVNKRKEEAEIKPRTKRIMDTSKITARIETARGKKTVYIHTDEIFSLTKMRDRAALQRLVNIINTALEEEI